MTSAPPQQNQERKKRPPPRNLAVIRKAYVTPNMLRVTLGGSELASFPEDSEGGYVKLQPAAPGDSDKPLLRTYTIRSFHPPTADSEAELNIDFVTHEGEGPAAKWAMDCAPGDIIKVGGPGPRKSLDHTADWFLLVGDMSALPAISVNLERLPEDAFGHVLLEVISPDDRQPLNVPPGMRVRVVCQCGARDARPVVAGRRQSAAQPHRSAIGMDRRRIQPVTGHPHVSKVTPRHRPNPYVCQ